jgi:lysophospholipase L1-like esterase
MAQPAKHLGVLAFGDSITNAGGELQWGVALQSWALWTARGLGLPYTGYAVDGARARDVTAAQIPAFRERAADPEGPYDLGCLYIGVNDARAPDWDGAAVSTELSHALRFLGERCERVLVVAPPRRLGRPQAAGGDELAALVRQAAIARRALLLDLGDFGARNHVMTDRVHPTALGQVAIARRALAVLAADGMQVRVDPALLVSPQRTRIAGLRGDLAYVWRDARQRARALRMPRAGRSRR